ncbi:Methionine aminopeptidase [Corynebacterium xerosis]|nr:Methionine aminopeptidase [Corynebacterium xerosis]
MIEILTPIELTRARSTGRLVAEILQELASRSVIGTSLLEIDSWARELILDAGAESCYVDYEPPFGRGPFGH